MNQAYTWAGVTGHTSSVAGSAMFDATDFCDDIPPDPIFPESLRISVTEAASDSEDN
jgi:hypothetical protein